MAFRKGRLLFGEDLKDDLVLSSPISSVKVDPDSDGEHSTGETPAESDLSANSGTTGAIPFEFDLSVSPSAFAKYSSRHFDSGIASPTPVRRSARRSMRPVQSTDSINPHAMSPVRLKYDDSADEDCGASPILKQSPGGTRPRPDFTALLEEEVKLLSSPVTPPSKRFRSLCLYDTPHTPKSLLEKAQRRTTRSVTRGSRSNRSSIGSNKSLLDPEGPQANINPFTPCDNSPSIFHNASMDLLKSAKAKPKGKGVKRVRNITSDLLSDMMDDDVDIPVNKKIALREINTSRYNEEFYEVEKLGDGEFGSVYKCIHRLDGCAYAIKKSKMPVAGSAYERSAMNEVYAHAVLGKHQHVVRYYSAWAERNHMFIQNEFCNGSSLADHLAERLTIDRPMNEAELKMLLLQVTDGLKYIHSQHLVHLDIKPGNVFLHKNIVGGESGIEEDLMEEEPDVPDPVCYKIGDLGHVTSVQSPEVEEGDVRYLPGEILTEKFNNLPKADIFSLALTVYQAGCSRELPKNGPSWHAIRKGRLPQLDTMSADFHKLLLTMIDPEPTKRPSAADLLYSPVLRPNHMSKAQLKRQLNEQLFQNQMLAKELEELKRNAVGMAPPTASMTTTTSKGKSKRLLGKAAADGKKVNRSLSVTCF